MASADSAWAGKVATDRAIASKATTDMALAGKAMAKGAPANGVTHVFSRRSFFGLTALAFAALATQGCAAAGSPSAASQNESAANTFDSATESSGADGDLSEIASSVFIEGSMEDRGFRVDDVLRHPRLGDIHFSLYAPGGHNGLKRALYIHCSGWEGFYSKGIGEHLVEDFPFVGNEYISDMVVIAPQLDDHRDKSAEMIIALTEWAIGAFDIDRTRIYLSGYSFGAETLSIVMGKRPELYRRVLHMASRWTGDIDTLVASRVPVRMTIGDADEYYPLRGAEETYRRMKEKYLAQSLSDEEIDELVVLDVKPGEYFEGRDSQHGGGAGPYAHDPDIMGWLFR